MRGLRSRAAPARSIDRTGRSDGVPPGHPGHDDPERMGFPMMAPACVNRFRSGLSQALARSGRSSRPRSRPRRPDVDVLEGRELLATFTVTNLHNAGAGSLRQAIIEANEQPGPDTIDFAVAGTIRVGRTSLPAITDTVTIDGSSAPSFAGTPVVTVDFQGTKGLQFAQRLRRIDPPRRSRW